MLSLLSILCRSSTAGGRWASSLFRITTRDVCSNFSLYSLHQYKSENFEFRDLLSTMDPKYQVPGRPS